MERGLAAILYADVAGYSRLTGLDEEQTHQKLDAGLNLLTSLVQEHGGRKIHEAGDAIPAEFQSVIASGSIEEITDLEEKSAGLSLIMEHYSEKDWEFSPQQLAKTRVWRIRIAEITGKQSSV